MKRILYIIREMFIPKSQEVNYADPDIKDFLKLAWDMRERLLESTTEGELEMFKWDIEWLEEEFQMRVPRLLLDSHLDDLTCIRLSKLRAYISFS